MPLGLDLHQRESVMNRIIGIVAAMVGAEGAGRGRAFARVNSSVNFEDDKQR